ncbi:uncharacterized protein LOC111596560 [Drosophila hydei]|uniref:Uncharacterized protein LOC111596560 n=1 Tax=Drosophila hydei TaxID=7224 RepID=A0A6J2SVL7_DROHY|nr:uncharacterized protein LOC111596560 [Drosophila hydei]
MLRLHDLYGQSYAHEFQFTNPDSIKNSVKRYNQQRAAERDENKKEREIPKVTKPRFCKMRNTGRDVLSMVTSRDLDIETQISLRQLPDTPRSSASGSTSVSSLDKIGNGNDPMQHASRLAGGADAIATPVNSNKSKKMRSRKGKRAAAKLERIEIPDLYTAHIEGLHRQVCAELEFMGHVQAERPKRKCKQRRLKQKSQPQPQPQLQSQTQNQHQQQLSKSKHSSNPRAQTNSQHQHQHQRKKIHKDPEPNMILQRLQQVLSEDQTPRAKQLSYYTTKHPTHWTDIISTPITPQSAQTKAYDLLNTANSDACLYMKHRQRVELEPEPLEDSDLEQEYADRPDYMRYTQRLPTHQSDPDMADGARHRACFVELEPHPNWISLQRSLKPMHYTSQRSDTDSSTLCDQQEGILMSDNGQSKAIIGDTTFPTISAKSKARKHEYSRQQSPSARHKQLASKSIIKSSKGTRQTKRKATLVQELTTGHRARQPGGGDRSPQSAALAISLKQSEQPHLDVSMPTLVPRRRKVRAVICTRSLENLKYQKMSIYNKISLTQERIISALDKLQCSLLQLPLIHTSSQEKQRRERNAFNFCVRFSRNYLYPLRGMIEDVRCTPVANFISATSNEASQRVVCVYGLMHHSVGRYQRQVRYFLLDKVPQKLSALIEMMYTLTNVCLEKGVLDRQDPVVECLQQRCTSFLTFIEDMQEQRFQLARESYRGLQRRGYGYGYGYGHGLGHAHLHGRGHGSARQDMHERYNLKMCLNDLKLYEPRLVPKERCDKRRPRIWLRKQKMATEPITAPLMPGIMLSQGSEMPPEQPSEYVPTHIERVQCGDHREEPSSDPDEPNQNQQLSKILALLQQPGQEKRELHQQLLEAMEHVTKSQVREVLDPLVRSLGVMLDKKFADEDQ